VASLKAAIYSILSTDAQINNTANLGGSTMLNNSATSPYSIYYFHPRVKPTPPFITYSVGSAIGEQPRMTEVLIACWGGEIVTIMNRVHALLDRQPLSSLTDYRFLQMIWDWHSPEAWDEERQIYVRTDRFLVKSWKT